MSQILNQEGTERKQVPEIAWRAFVVVAGGLISYYYYLVYLREMVLAGAPSLQLFHMDGVVDKIHILFLFTTPTSLLLK